QTVQKNLQKTGVGTMHPRGSDEQQVTSEDPFEGGLHGLGGVGEQVGSEFPEVDDLGIVGDADAVGDLRGGVQGSGVHGGSGVGCGDEHGEASHTKLLDSVDRGSTGGNVSGTVNRFRASPSMGGERS